MNSLLSLLERVFFKVTTRVNCEQRSRNVTMIILIANIYEAFSAYHALSALDTLTQLILKTILRGEAVITPFYIQENRYR